MLTEQDLRDVLNEWADAAADAEGTDQRPQRKPRRWLAPLAAAAAVAAAAIAITVVTNRDPAINTVGEPAPTHSTILQPAHAPNLSTLTPKWMTDNLRRFLPKGTVSHVTGRAQGDAAYVALDYDDGHGVAGLRVWVGLPTVAALAKAGTGCTGDDDDAIAQRGSCSLGRLAAPPLHCPGSFNRSPSTCGGVVRALAVGTNGIREWTVGDFSSKDIVVQLELTNAPRAANSEPTRTSRLLSDRQLDAIVTDASWSDRAR